jgi:16S rRNA (adenine1518-N6/adenine1519-N6)-dimethyltransferase
MRQKFGQNFLIDLHLAQEIVDAAELTPADHVIEVGPGKGVLTERILATGARLTAIEIDRHLAAALQARFAGNPQFTCSAMNVMDAAFPAEPFTLIANLPYYLATAILEKLLPGEGWTTAIVMVQKEVADRIVAQQGTRDYGVLSVMCQYYAEAEIILNAGPAAFSPRPKIDSAVLKLQPLHPQQPDPALFALVKHAFQHRRKTILNSLSTALRQEKNVVLAALQTAQIDPMARPETLGIPDFVSLTNVLKKYILLQDDHSAKS